MAHHHRGVEISDPDHDPSGEVRGAKKQEFNLEQRIWTIPVERTKMRREHLVPLSDQSLKIVENNWPEIEGVNLIFPSLVSNRKWISENAFNSALRRLGYQKEEVTAHGFRATASTILNSRGFVPTFQVAKSGISNSILLLIPFG